MIINAFTISCYWQTENRIRLFIYMMKTLKCIIIIHISTTTCHRYLSTYNWKNFLIILNIVNFIYST